MCGVLNKELLNMAADRIKPLVGESDLIDGALRGSRSKEDGYRVDDENRETVDREDDEDETDTIVVELGMKRSIDREDDEIEDDSPPNLEELKAKAAREWEKEIGTVEIIDDPVRMYLREIGRVDLLKAPEERELARKFEGKRYVEKLEEELTTEDGTPPKAREIMGHMLKKVGQNEDIIKAILTSKEVPFNGSLPDLMANPDIRDALDGIFQDELLEQISAILSELRDEDPPELDELKDMIKQASMNTRLLPDDIFKGLDGIPNLNDVDSFVERDDFIEGMQPYELVFMQHIGTLFFLNKNVQF